MNCFDLLFSVFTQAKKCKKSVTILYIVSFPKVPLWHDSVRCGASLMDKSSNFLPVDLISCREINSAHYFPGQINSRLKKRDAIYLNPCGKLRYKAYWPSFFPRRNMSKITPVSCVYFLVIFWDSVVRLIDMDCMYHLINVSWDGTHNQLIHKLPEKVKRIAYCIFLWPSLWSQMQKYVYKYSNHKKYMPQP